jgi:hypothetical protein
MAGASAGHSTTGHCVEQVSFMIKDSAGNIINSGATDLRNPYMLLSVSDCYSQTVTDFHANTSWAQPNEVCPRYPGTQANAHFYVMASAYFQELGNANGVNKVAGYSMHCTNGQLVGWPLPDPAGVVVVPHVY